MITDVENLVIGHRIHTGTKIATWRSFPSCSNSGLLPLNLSPARRNSVGQQTNLDSEPCGSDANPGIAGALTFARSTPTRPVSVGGPRFFRTRHACVDDLNRHRPGMNLPTDRGTVEVRACKQNKPSVQESVVRTRLRVLPPVGTGGTSRTWLTSDDVRVALFATF